MPYSEDEGWVAQPQGYWYSRLIAEARELRPLLNWNVGSNNSIEKENEASYYAIWDLEVASFKSQLSYEFATMNLKIQSANSNSVVGICRGFLSISYVAKCVVIRAKLDNPNCYLFIEITDENGKVIDFTELTEEQRIELLSMAAETHTVTKPRSKYVDEANPINIIEGDGMINGNYLEKNSYEIINQIRRNQLPKIKIRVWVTDKYFDGVHQISETEAIKKDFLEEFEEVQQVGVDFSKMNYVCTIKNERIYIYDYDFYDTTDENNLIDMNIRVVEEFGYFVEPADNMVIVDFYKLSEKVY